MRDQKGFTLIELLLYIGISAMVLLALSAFFITLLNARTRNETIAEVDQQGAAVLAMMTQTVRNAQAISFPALGTSGASLSVTVDDASLSPTVYSIVGDTFMVSEGSNDSIALTNSKVRVTDLMVENLSRPGTLGNVRITFTLARASDSARREYDYSRTFEGSASLR